MTSVAEVDRHVMTLATLRLDALARVLAAISLCAWSVLVFGRPDWIPTAWCSRGLLVVAPLAASFRLALLVNSPARLALAWTLMVAAMMSPLLWAPLRHVGTQFNPKRCAWAMLLFAAGYMEVWLIAGVALQPMALALRYAVPEPLVGLGIAALVASFWQITPAKQWCLNCCHCRPPLTATGVVGDCDVFLFGLWSGAACAGACWALMLLPLFVAHGHLLAMIAVAVFVIAERRKPPARAAWRWPHAGGVRSVRKFCQGDSHAGC